MPKQCQSCGMPLQTERAGDCRGSEKDGSKSSKWCQLCYLDGAFINPDCTLDEMKDIVDTALREQGRGKIMRMMALSQIPRLDRWRARPKGFEPLTF